MNGKYIVISVSIICATVLLNTLISKSFVNRYSKVASTDLGNLVTILDEKTGDIIRYKVEDEKYSDGTATRIYKFKNTNLFKTVYFEDKNKDVTLNQYK